MILSHPRLCVFHPGSLGDCLLSIPALRILRENFPSHSLVWYGNPEVGDLLLISRIIDERHAFDQRNFLSMNPWRLSTDAGDDQPKILDHRAVCWVKDSDGWWKAWCEEQGASFIICRSPCESSWSSLHVSDRYVQTLFPWIDGGVGVTSNSSLINESLSIASCTPSSLLPREPPIIAIHPGSGSIHKCTSPDFMINLVEELITHELGNIVLLGGPADSEVFRHLAVISHDKVRRIQGLNLLAMSEVLQQVQVYVGHDSGLSHLSACLGVPSLLLFGPTTPEHWAPRGPHVRIVENSCSCDTWEVVRECSTKSCLKFSPSTVREDVQDLLKETRVRLLSQEDTLVR